MKTRTQPRLAMAAGMTAGALLFAVPSWACGSHGQVRIAKPLFIQAAVAAESSKSTVALQNSIEDLLALVKAMDWPGAKKSLNALVLPGYQAWFKSVFGEAQGAKLASEYTEFAKFLASEDGAKELQDPIRNGRTRVDVELIKATGDKNNFRDQTISTMKSKTPIYLVRLINPADARDFFHMGYFAHVDGQFSSIGKL